MTASYRSAIEILALNDDCTQLYHKPFLSIGYTEIESATVSMQVIAWLFSKDVREVMNDIRRYHAKNNGDYAIEAKQYLKELKSGLTE